MDSCPLFSIVVLNYNGKKVLLPCLESLLKTEYDNFEIVLVDNHSTDGSIEEVEDKFPACGKLKIIKNPVPRFYAGGNNVGVKHASGEYIVFLNNDTEVDPGWLNGLRKVFADPRVGAAQPKVLYYYDREVIDNAGLDLDMFGFGCGKDNKKLNSTVCAQDREIFAASGVAMAVRRDLLERVGVFDEKYVYYYEDLDLSWRIRLAGYKVISCHGAIVFHKVSKTTRVYSQVKDLAFHARKNRIFTMAKNYSWLYVLLTLPVTLFIYFVLYLKELIADRDLPLANTVFFSLFWNIRHFPYLLKEHRFVQRKIRKISDWEILRRMTKIPLALKQVF